MWFVKITMIEAIGANIKILKPFIAPYMITTIASNIPAISMISITISP
jgi:hypothetical protein